MLGAPPISVIMDPAISFGNLNSGLQVGINYGPINTEFHLPNLDDKLPIVHGAAFDSYSEQHEDDCLPGTRTDILREIREWAFSPQGRCIFWLNGMAGTGKSTISRTVARSFSQAKSLGASFFFKRGEGDRGNAVKLFPTIARQLAISIPQLVPCIQKSVHDNPDIATKAMKEQFDKLILQPLLSLRPSDLPIQTVVIVIDALDECEVDNDIRLIIQLLPQLRNSRALRLRVFLTSRPELPIRLGFSKIASHDHKDLILHEVPEKVIDHDISLFLNHRISVIRRERLLPIDWPGDNKLRYLVILSVPLFIFAATICRIFEDPYWDPDHSLTEILANQNDGSTLDGTYLPVLNRLLNGQNEKQEKQLVQEFQQVVGAIVILESPLSVISFSRLMGLSERLVRLRLNPLHSVLSVPDDESLPVRLFHLSFRDFLLDPETRKKTPFWVNEKQLQHELTIRCLIICRNLRNNICGLRSHGIKRMEIDRQVINHCLSPELQYACRYWAHHLVQCAELNTDVNVVMHYALLFLQEHFLHWVEAMSLLGLISEVVGIIDLLHTTVPSDNESAMSEFLHDAKRFILKNRQIADDAPLQLYCSGLVFAPRTSIIRWWFRKELPTCISRLPLVRESWNAELQALEGHSKSVNSVAFSSDGRLLASVSKGETARLWNTTTGALHQTFEGHSSPVKSVVFSPDGRLLASRSFGHIIWLWDTATGVLHQTLQDDSGSVESVAFSPDSRLLASGSDNGTIRFWDTITGILQQTLEGHASLVKSVAFSPDGRLLASGSYDRTVRLWNTAIGALHQTLQGDLGWLLSVAFSPDGRLLASGSHDKKVRLWDTATGALYQALEGHSSSVKWVAFSSDGRRLASRSYDRTVRLWDTATGALLHTLGGQSSPIKSVAFSPNSRLLASGLYSGTIQLWDTATGVLRQTFQGHLRSVGSVAFSADGRLLASGSYNGTIRFWDTAIGARQPPLRGHSGLVKSVVFSPNGRILASRSNDRTVRLWDTETGALRQTLGGQSSPIEPVVFSPNGRILASRSNDRTVRLWDTATGALLHTLGGQSSPIKSVAFSPNSRLLASGLDNGTIQLWDTATGVLRQTFEGHSGMINSVTFSSDGRLLAASSIASTIQLWDTATGVLRQTFEGHSEMINSVTLSSDGRLLAAGSIAGTIQLWDTETGVFPLTFEGHLGKINSVTFSSDGRLLAAGSSNGTIQLCDTVKGTLQGTLRGHSHSVRSLEFKLLTHSELLLESHYHDGTVQSWDIRIGKRLLTRESQSPSVGSSAFSPNRWRPNPPRANLMISIYQEQWITLNGKKVLWLPPGYRPTCSAFKDSILALGHASGQVSFIGFEV